MRRASFVRMRPRLAQSASLPQGLSVKAWRLLFLATAFLGAVSCSKKETPVTSKSTETPAASASAKPGWLTDYDAAQKEAQAKNKLLLMDFTGSDWCGWCIMLDKEVFSKPEFKEYANKHLVLLELDFPRSKQLPPETAAQNQKLLLKYRVQGFPTVVVFDSSGKPLGALGYEAGGPKVFIDYLEKLRQGVAVSSR